MKQENNEKKLEDILKVFSVQGELVNNLGDALQNIALAGHFNENGEWEEPEWKNTALFHVAQARALIKVLLTMSQTQQNI